MRPRRLRGITEHVFRLPGGTEDNDLFCTIVRPCEETPTGAVTSYWKPDEDELTALLRGGYIELTTYAVPPPPVSIGVVELAERRPS